MGITKISISSRKRYAQKMSGCGTVLIPSSWYFIDLCLEEERSIQSVWSDNGANFEPGASHMGGVWEC